MLLLKEKTVNYSWYRHFAFIACNKRYSNRT